MVDGETVWIDVEGPLQETDLALLFRFDDKEHWVPRSQLGARKRDPNDRQRIIRVEVTVWFAKKVGVMPKKMRVL